MRAQVRGFIGMLRALDLKRTPLLSHPAITGMQSGSSHCLGQLRTVAPLSDATDRRKRGPRTAHSDGEKANYGKSGDGITMRLGRRGVHSRQRLASHCVRHDASRQRVLNLLVKINRTGERVAPTKGVNYAPTVLPARPDAVGVGSKQLESATPRLLANGGGKHPGRAWQPCRSSILRSQTRAAQRSRQALKTTSDHSGSGDSRERAPKAADHHGAGHNRTRGHILVRRSHRRGHSISADSCSLE